MSGKWDDHYRDLQALEPYGQDESYRLIAEWLSPCASIEDWGCGKGWLRRFIDEDAYRGIDGSCSPFADIVADLTTYTSKVEGIALRHVLEHSDDWPDILANALESFEVRLCIVLFTPLTDETTVLMREPEYGDVPVISFALDDILAPIRASGCEVEEIETIAGSFYGVETIIRASR